MRIESYFCYFSTKTNIVGAYQNHLIKASPMSSPNMGFCEEIMNNILSYHQIIILSVILLLTFIPYSATNTKIADLVNTVDPDETAHKEPSHLDL